MIEKIKSITRGQVILLALILLIGFVAYISVGIAKSHSIKNYKQFEKELISSAENYYKINNLTIKEGGEKRISIKTLEKHNLVTNELKDKCRGYIIISNTKDIYTEEFNIEYRSYIKCGNIYTTSGYTIY